METTTIIFLALLFVVAMLYASVGHGGASGYLALMGVFQFAPDVMRPSALVLNVLVSLVAAWQFSRTEKLDTRLFFWLAAASIPASFIGATITIDATVYKKILGVMILFQAARLIGFFEARPYRFFNPTMAPALVSGGSIGLLSGLIGIGGGIILSPFLLMLGWATVKQTALISALFIFVNSLAGIAGLLAKGTSFGGHLYVWVGVAMAGGLIGSRFGSTRFSPVVLKKILGFVLAIAAVKLIFQ